MADKVQNVLVNFKFNTAELEKATQLTNRANEASNRLQQTASNAGKKLGDSFRQPIQSIESMRVQLARLKASLDLAVDPRKVQQLSAQYKELKKRLDEATKAAYKLNEESKKLGELGQAISTLFTAAVLKQVVDVGLSLARLSGNAEGVERAFRRAFPNSVQTLNDLREATRGTVDDLQLMQRTLQATNLGVAVEQLPILFEFAAARAQQTGESVDYLVDSIVRGIGRKSILVLDNLGLSATRLKEEFNGASLASQSVADVTKGVANIAKVELAKMGGYVDTAATKVGKLEASWENLRATFAKRIDSGPVIQFFTEAFQGLDSALKGAKGLRDEVIQNGAAQSAANVIQDKAFQDLKDNQAAQIDLLLQEIAERQRLIRLRQSEIDQASKRRQQIIDELGFFEDQELATRNLNEMVKAQTRSRDILQASIPILKNYIDELRKIGNKEELGIIEAKRKEIEKIQEAIEKTRSSGDLSSRLGVGKLVTDLEVAQAELKELLEGPQNKEFKINTQSIKDATKEFEKLLNTVKNVTFGGITIKPIKASLENNEVSVEDPILVRAKELEVLPASDAVINMSEWEKAFEDVRQDLFDNSLGIFTDQLISFEEAEVASLQNRLNNLRNFYDEQQILAGDNEKAKQELRLKEERESAALQKKIAQKEKEARRFSVLVNTAAGIVRAYAENPFPLATLYSGIIAAQGASQLAIINRTQARFKDGVINLKGPGTGTSDSIHARLSRGESVMTAKETQNSMGILKDIRAKRLDDRVLKDLKLSAAGVSVSGLDDSRILAELQKIREGQPNIVEQSGKLYNQYSKGRSYKVKSRISAMGY